MSNCMVQGYRLVLVTNQAGIATGKTTVEKFQTKMNNLLARLGVKADIYCSASDTGYYRKVSSTFVCWTGLWCSRGRGCGRAWRRRPGGPAAQSSAPPPSTAGTPRAARRAGSRERRRISPARTDCSPSTSTSPSTRRRNSFTTTRPASCSLHPSTPGRLKSCRANYPSYNCVSSAR